jgi:hypothetical protein
MPVAQKSLLADCQRQLKLLENDLKAQATALPELDASLRAEWEAARDAKRVGDAFEIWRGEQATQAAVHWVLGTVFVRFLEDNGLIDPVLAGEGDRGRLAESAEQAFYMANPTLHERDWLLQVFRQVAALPGGAALFDAAHNPVFRWPLSPDAAKRLLQFWRRVDPATGTLVHDFADPEWATRFLGDLYQDLSEGARKKYALLQTPDFVESFILDRTLGEALKVLPLAAATMIDPTCGSGHFMLGTFARLLAAWEAKEPSAPREVLAQRALDQVAGVDLNPFAVAIARFRLLIAALRACEVRRLDRAPGFHLHVAVGDALLHGDEPGLLALGDGGRGRYVRHAFADEDLAEVTKILSRRYAVVVGNPPYITPKDAALRVAYKERYQTCHMKYALSVPFVERFWELTATSAGGDVAGWMGQITANSFMKREFGKKLIEEYLPTRDLTHVVDASGAYIPGHGTPTVLLFGRARKPSAASVRVVVCRKGEPTTPADPASGRVWTSLRDHVIGHEREDEFVAAMETSRTLLAKHPWSAGIGEGSAKESLDAACSEKLADFVVVTKQVVNVGGRVMSRDTREIGVFGMTNADEAMLAPAHVFRRQGVEESLVRRLVVGDSIRDWIISPEDSVLFPYHERGLVPLDGAPGLAKWLWPMRTVLGSRATFGGGTYLSEGRPWWEWHQVALRRIAAPFTVTFSFVATHNHFALSRGEVVFSRTAPVMNLVDSDEVGQLGLVGILNSSAACYWIKQVAYNRGDSTDAAGARVTGDPAFDTYEWTATQVADLPVPSGRPSELAGSLHSLAKQYERYAVGLGSEDGRYADSRMISAAADHIRRRMVALQEELDWRCYHLYGLTEDELTLRDEAGAPVEPPPIGHGERAFEIVLARRMAAGEEETTWFTRHGSTPLTEIPAHWPAEYRVVVERRIARIEQDRNIALIERPEYKRRWNVEPWETQERAALDTWLLDRLESPTYWPTVALQTTRDLAERAALDPEFAQVAALRFGEGVALEPAIRELVSGEAVPFLPALRYTEAGREKRRVWEQVWALQRREDAVDAAVSSDPAFAAPREGESQDAFTKRLAAAQKAQRDAEVGAIPRPPKYTSADFQRAEFWKMRGALDVPKERFISYPFCGREGDDAPLLGWAGWRHLQQAEALAGWYATRTEQDGWHGERVIPMLAGMAELVPWLRQWHNDIDPQYGDRPGEEFARWLDEALHTHGLTRQTLESWEPPRAARAPRKTAARKTAARQTS